VEAHLDTEHAHSIFGLVIFFSAVVADIRRAVVDTARCIGRPRILAEINGVRVNLVSIGSNMFVESLRMFRLTRSELRTTVDGGGIGEV